MKIKNKSLYFIITLVLTIILTRIITLYIHDPNRFIKGLELHHFYYGISLLIIATLIFISYKKQKTLYLTLYAISLGWIIDELEYVVNGFGNTKAYATTLPSVIILTFSVILITLHIKFKSSK